VIALSLNEIDTAVKRAARGAGLSWGLAEDAGKAARLLAARGVCGLDLVLRALRAEDSGRPEESPFRIGPALCDGAFAARPDGSIHIGPVRDPVMLAGYAALLAISTGRALCVSWPDCDVLLDAGATQVRGAGLGATVAPQVRVAPVPAVVGRDRGARSETDEETWSALLALGERTFVPASAQSRATGAGAGLSDND
jgi:hypothetical protein